MAQGDGSWGSLKAGIRRPPLNSLRSNSANYLTGQAGVREKKLKAATGVCTLPSGIHCQFESNLITYPAQLQKHRHLFFYYSA